MASRGPLPLRSAHRLCMKCRRFGKKRSKSRGTVKLGGPWIGESLGDRISVPASDARDPLHVGCARANQAERSVRHIDRGMGLA
jgi:hypothetical protein